MIAGQYLDLRLAAEAAPTELAARRVALLKSARYTVTRPLQLGAALGGGSAELDRRRSRPTATRSGSPSSCATTCSALFGDPALTGKGRLDDLREGKRTLLVVRALALGDERQRDGPPRLRWATRPSTRSGPPAAATSSPPPARWRRSRRSSPTGSTSRCVPSRASPRPVRTALAASPPSPRTGKPDDDPRSSSSAPAWPGCRPPATSPGPGHDVVVVEAGDGPGGRAGSLELGGYRFDTGPTVLTMPELVERCFAAVGADMADYLTLRPVDPDVPGLLRRRQRAARAPRPRRDGRGDRVGVRPGEADGVRPVLRLAHRALRASRCRTSSTATSTRRSTWSARSRPALELVRLGGFRRLAAAVAAVLRRRAARAPVQLPGAVRRPGAVRGARAVRRDHLHGRRQRRVRPRRRHARAAGRARRGGRRTPASRFRYGTPGRADRARRGAAAGAGVRLAAASWSPPTRSSARRPARRLPHAAARPRRRPGGRRGRLLAVRARVARRRPRRAARTAWPTTTSTSGRRGTTSFRALLDDGSPHARPVDAGHRADHRRAGDGAAGPPRALRARAGAQPRRPRRLDRRARAGRATTSLAARRPARLPDRRRGRAARRSARLGGAGHGAGHAVRAVAPVPPDRPVPAGQRRAPGAGPGVRRLRHGARRRRADGAGVRRSWRRERVARQRRPAR